MKAATINELKQELTHIPHAQLTELCLRLARFKKENKELLTYLLFEANDAEAFVRQVKEEMDTLFAEINTSHVYFAKKTLRKIIRTADKYIRYCGQPAIEAELRIYFCLRMNGLGLPVKKTPVLHNMYQGQLKKIEKTVSLLHEDLQHDFRREMEAL